MLETASLGYLPHVILGAYLVLLLAFGLIGYLKGSANTEDYYLAGRSQGWWVSSLTIMATFFSSFALLGAPGMVYRDGVVFALFSLNVPLAGTAVYFLGSRIRRQGRAQGHVTPADMFAAHYASPVGLRLVVALIGLLYAIPYIVIQIQAGGILSQQLFSSPQAFERGAVLLALITMLYIMVGGMRSVAWTDVVQGLLLVGGMLLGGAAIVALLGGPGPFFEAVGQLPRKSLSVPGTVGHWTPEILFTASVFASLGSMVQPAQWMRFYAARSDAALRRSALIFAVVLTACFFFGVMLIGLGGQVLYPLVDEGGAYRLDASGRVLPHPAVGATAGDFDQILVVVLKTHLPELMGPAGAVLAALVLVAIMAAAMSTADSSLHATSAMLTRDIYLPFIRPQAAQKERAWVGRLVIVFITLLALALLIIGHRSESNPLGMIVILGLLAIAFSTQLLPATIDMLFLRRGTKLGALSGMLTGLVIVFGLSPFLPMLTGDGLQSIVGAMKKMMDTGAWGLVGNVLVFAGVSWVQGLKSQT